MFLCGGNLMLIDLFDTMKFSFYFPTDPTPVSLVCKPFNNLILQKTNDDGMTRLTSEIWD